MGRTLKRVPMDFDWPLGKVWDGYLNPYYQEQETCKDCDGSGYSTGATLLNSLWYRHLHYRVPYLMGACPPGAGMAAFALRIVASGDAWAHQLDQDDVQALVDAGRLYDFTRVPRTPEQIAAHQEYRANGGGFWMREPNGYVPTAEEVNAWSKQGMGHDGINCGVCIEARCKRYGLSDRCAMCDGHGHLPNPELEAKIEAWTETEPPLGEGYQLWGTTSEGSPKSPVFDTLWKLCVWCESNATTFADYRATAAEWQQMLERDLVTVEMSDSAGNSIVFM